MLPEVTLKNKTKEEIKRYMDQGGEVSPELIFEAMEELLVDAENTIEDLLKQAEDFRKMSNYDHE